MGRRYTCTPPPLDLRGDVLLAGSDVLAGALDDLDEDGWSRTAKWGSTTLTRVRIMMAVVRDELLEIALGHGEDGDLHVLG